MNTHMSTEGEVEEEEEEEVAEERNLNTSRAWRSSMSEGKAWVNQSMSARGTVWPCTTPASALTSM